MKIDKRLAAVAVALLVTVVTVLAAPGFLSYDISYKNEKLDIELPVAPDSETGGTKFTLPVIYIHSYDKENLKPTSWEKVGDGLSMPPRVETSADLYMFEREENFLNDIPTHVYYDEMMKIRGRSSSYAQDKKPFSLEFRGDDGLPVNFDFMGLGAESDFVLHAPFIDRSLVRNFLAYNLQAQLTDWSPECRFAEVFIGSGENETLTMNEYEGVYLVVEKIKRDKNRIVMGEYRAPKEGENLFYEGGNIIYKRDTYEAGYDTAIRLEENSHGNAYSVVYPKAEDTGDEGRQAIYNEVQHFEDALYNGSDEEFAGYYDIEQIARVMLLDELLKNFEGFSSSLYYYRPQGEKVKVIQWDFDIGTGNDDYKEDLSNTEGFYILAREQYVEQYLAHDNFKEALVNQWKALRSEGGALSEENIIALLNDAENQLDGAWQRNDGKFGYIFKDKIPFGNAHYGNNLENSLEEREYIKQFLIERGNWLDEHIDEIRELY